MGNPVVLELKCDGQTIRKRPRTAFVVVLGSIISAVERKHYGNCILYEDTENGCQFVVEQTEDRAADKSMLQQFGQAGLMYFRTAVESMWARLRGNGSYNVEEALKMLEYSDPNRHSNNV